MKDDAKGAAARRRHSGDNADAGRRGNRLPRLSLSKQAKRNGGAASSDDDESDSSGGDSSAEEETCGDSDEPRQRRSEGRQQRGGNDEVGSAGDDGHDRSPRVKDSRIEMPGVLDGEAESFLQEFLKAQQAQDSPAEEEANADPYQDAANHDLLASNPSLVDQALYNAIHNVAAEADGSEGAAAGSGPAPGAAAATAATSAGVKRPASGRSKSVESVGSSGDIIRCSSTDTEDELVKKQGNVVRKYNEKAQYWTDRAQELLRLSEDGFRPGTMKRDKKVMKESKRKKDKKDKKRKKESKPDRDKRDLDYNREALRRAEQAQAGKRSGPVVRAAAARSASHAPPNMAGMW